jgi:hypothetical protein
MNTLGGWPLQAGPKSGEQIRGDLHSERQWFERSTPEDCAWVRASACPSAIRSKCCAGAARGTSLMSMLEIRK